MAIRLRDGLARRVFKVGERSLQIGVLVFQLVELLTQVASLLLELGFFAVFIFLLAIGAFRGFAFFGEEDCSVPFEQVDPRRRLVELGLCLVGGDSGLEFRSFRDVFVLFHLSQRARKLPFQGGRFGFCGGCGMLVNPEVDSVPRQQRTLLQACDARRALQTRCCEGRSALSGGRCIYVGVSRE